MDLSGRVDAAPGDAPLPPAASSSLAQKHPLPTGLDLDHPPAKRPRQHGKREPFDLDKLSLLCTDGTRMLAITVLNALAEPAFTRGELRNAHHYDYEELREWLQREGGIPRDVAMRAILPDQDGQNYIHIVGSKWSFAGLLGTIKNGILTVPTVKPFGPVLTLEPCEGALLDARPPPEEAAAELPQAPPPVPPPAGHAAAEEAGPEVGHTQPKHGHTGSTQQPVIDLTAVEDGAAAGEEDAPEVVHTQPEHGHTGSTQQPVIDLTAIEDGAAAEEDAAGLTSCDAALFAKALRFFQAAKQADGKYTIKGIARSVHSYQLYTAYGLLMAPVTTGVNGAIVGWDVGFGKTMLMLLYLWARSRLALLWEEVSAEREDKAGTAPRRHLPRKSQPANARCPSQDRLAVECPCVFASSSRRVCATYLTDSPAVIVIPPGLAHGWLREIRDTYKDGDNQAEHNKPLDFYTHVSSVKHYTSVPKPSDTRGWEELIEATSGQVVADEMEDEEGQAYIQNSVESGAGGATDVFLVSSKSVAKLQQRYPSADGTGTTCFTAGVVIMDEHQQYKGSTESADTIPFDALKKMSDAAQHPVTLFTLCGTTLEEGPSAWRAPVAHFHDQWLKFGKKELKQIRDSPRNSLWCGGGELDAVADDRFAAARRQYLDLVREIANDTMPVAELGPGVRMLVGFLRPILWCLRQGQRYRGQLINPLPPCQEDYRQLDPVMDDRTGEAFRALVGSVRSLIYQKLKKLMVEWEADGRAGPKPTEQSVVEDLASGQKGTNSSFINLQRASMYPHMAVLQKTLDQNAFAATTCQAAADKCQKMIVQGAPPDEALAVLRTWDFFAHLDMLARNSAKFQHVRALVDRMVSDQDRQTTPPDGSGRRHAILFHSQPISAMVTYVLLLRDPALRGVVKPLLLCSKCSNEERGSIVKEMNEACTAQSPSKVLIALSSIAAEGFNIQRANNVWFAELPVSLSKKEQAKGRAHRQGQRMRVDITYLVERGNLMEELGYDAMKAKETVSRLVYGLQHVA